MATKSSGGNYSTSADDWLKTNGFYELDFRSDETVAIPSYDGAIYARTYYFKTVYEFQIYEKLV